MLSDTRKNYRIITYVSHIKYPKIPSYSLGIYCLIRYIRLVKSAKKFMCLPVPHNVLQRSTKHKMHIDVNNCIIVNKHFHKVILEGSELVRIVNPEGCRITYVIGEDIIDDQIVISDTLRFNLNAVPSSPLYKLTKCNFDVKLATEVHISFISGGISISNSVADVLIKNYFKNPKILYKNDIISMCLKYYAPEYFYTNNKINEANLVYFRCQKVKYKNIDDYKGVCFCVTGETTLKQSADTQQFIPSSTYIMKNNLAENSQLLDTFIIACPEGLKKYHEQLIKAIRPFTKNQLKLKPSFLLQGDRGSGKTNIIQAVAKYFGLHLFKLSAIEMMSTSYAQVESKLNYSFQKAKLCSPCLLAIYNFENLCKNNEGQYDLRIINYFKSELTRTLFANNNFPIILICISNAKDLPADLSRIFLETINTEAPNEKERSTLLKWLLDRDLIKATIKIDQVAQKSHGFLFEDLKTLIYYAMQNKYSNKNRSVDYLTADDFDFGMQTLQTIYTETLDAPKVPTVEWSDVGGLDDVKQEIIRTISLPLKHPELLRTANLKRSGILLYGPPGTGKTLIAKAVATQCDLCFLSVKGPELLNMYVGQSEQNVREIFEKARQASPCIIFFDELDSLAPNRGMSGDSGGVTDRVVSQLLSEMDGLNKESTVFIIGATNRPDLIDQALLRPGRFDKLLYVGPCTDTASKLSVLKALTRKFHLSENLCMEKLIKICPQNITGADFYGICSNAWMIAASRIIKKMEKGKVKYDDVSTHNVVVTLKDFEEAIKNAKSSVNTEDLIYFKQLKQELSSNK